MKKFLPACLLACALSGAVQAATLLTEGFEDSFPPAGWAAVSIDQSTTYAHTGANSAKFSATSDSLITPAIAALDTLTFWSYTTSVDPGIIVEQGSSTNGPWAAVPGSPFSGNTDQWNQRTVMIASTNSLYFRFTKSGSGSLYIDDVSFDDGIAASNLPPVLDPIGNKNVLEMGTLSFSVTADDPIDHDAVTLSTTNLPTGATFSTNGIFIWSNAAPAGIYAVTFYATDKDGSDSETIDITVTERPILLISEIADPAGTGADVYRFVELYNAGARPINLGADGWTLSKQVNGGTWYDIPLTGTVAAASAWVIAYSAVDFQDVYGFAPDQESRTVSGNGDDAYFLYYNGNHTHGVMIDLYGEFNTDGTGTAWDYEDSRAVRNNNVLQPNSVWTASEWTITAGAETGDMTPSAHGPVPGFQGLENQFVFTGDSLSFVVTAANDVLTNDVITLSATALPAGAAFASATGTNIASSTLNWNNPTNGTYTATFAAAGSAGTSTTSITITVSSRSQIDGRFYGWETDTIVKLKNGQFWKNTGGVGTPYPGLLNPGVTVTNQLGSRRMIIDGVTGDKTVEQISIIESAVTNPFTGLHNSNIYQLADGTIWKQISFENIISNVTVTAWRWTESGKQMMRFVDRNHVVIGTCIAEASVPPADDTVRSEIDSYFRGWQNKRIFALANGQFWQQTSLDSSSQTLWRPSITVSNWLQTGNWRLSVAGTTGTVPVQQITNVVRTAIVGNFYGFGRDEIFRLANGSWWRQTSLESSTSMRSNPEIFIWSEGGTDYLEMPDEGRRVAAEQLNTLFESTVTNSFSGLHYGNLYRLDGAGDWLQISFENARTNVVSPEVMLWVDGSETNLAARNSRDVTIGTCTVVDPVIDSDSDGLSNADEIVAGSDPLNEQSRFELRQTDQYILNWDSVEGRIYTIEWAPSLTTPFQTLENSIVWPQNSWTDTAHSVDSKGFYRISVRLAE